MNNKYWDYLTWHDLTDEEQEEVRQRYINLLGTDAGVQNCNFYKTELGELVFV